LLSTTYISGGGGGKSTFRSTVTYVIKSQHALGGLILQWLDVVWWLIDFTDLHKATYKTLKYYLLLVQLLYRTVNNRLVEIIYDLNSVTATLMQKINKKGKS